MAPTFSRAHLALGKALLQEGKVDEATTALQEATRLDAASGEVLRQIVIGHAARRQIAAGAGNARKRGHQT